MKELDKYSLEELREEIYQREKPSTDPIGLWNVTTEGDCEGRSIDKIGIHEGHFADIALQFAGRTAYSLSFSRAKPEEVKDYSGSETRVSVPYEVCSSTDKEIYTRAMQAWLGSDWIVEPHTYYKTVTIKRSGE